MPNEHENRGGLLGWVERRYHVTPLFEFLRHKEVPLGSHWMGWYYLGGVTMFFFIVQVITGVLLLMYFQPGEATAYESIRFLTTKVPFGWLIRSIHSWSAHLMIISLVLHMFSTMMLKAYRPPRELTWVSGYLLFLLTLGFGFSGYLLPWNKLAYFATTVGTNIVRSVPLLGDWLLEVLRGGQDVTINTLYRFFAAHVVILPLAFVGIIALHLLLIQRQGMASPVGETRAPRGMKFFPSFALRDLLLVARVFDVANYARRVSCPTGRDSGNGLGTGRESRPVCARLSRDQTGMVFSVGVSTAQGISAAPFRPRRTSDLSVRDRNLVRHLDDHPLARSTCLSQQAIAAFSDLGWAAILFLDLSDADGLGHRRRRQADDPDGAAQNRRGSAQVDVGWRAQSSSSCASGVTTIAGSCSRAQRCCMSRSMVC